MVKPVFLIHAPERIPQDGLPVRKPAGAFPGFLLTYKFLVR
jgi:hypothetical protein